MTDPFFLETLLAPDLLDVERPFVIAHEWGHLAGFADESEANFIAWLACRRGHTARAVQRVVDAVRPRLRRDRERSRGHRRAGAGPRDRSARDLRSICADVTLGAARRARNLRSVSAREQSRARGGELRRSRSAHPGNGVRSRTAIRRCDRGRGAALCSLTAACRGNRAISRGIELVHVGRRQRHRAAAGAKVVRADVLARAQKLHVAPSTPSALVASIGLAIGHFLPQPLHCPAQARRVHARGRTLRALHW